MRWSWLRWLPAAAALVMFLPPALDGGFVADDTINLSQHAAHGDLLGEWRTPTYAHAGGDRGHIWRPIPATLQHLAAMALGRDGAVFRVLNVGVHLLNLLLLGAVLRRRGVSVAITTAVLLAWTAHPAMSEAIGWSSDIYDLAATTALLAMLWALQRTQGLAAAGAVGVGMLVAALCKESAITFAPIPALLMLAEGRRREALAALLAAGAGVGVYLLLHHSVTAEGYAGAFSATPLLWKLQAGLAGLGWLVVVPSRALMAHLWSPTEWLEPLTGALVALGWLAGAAAAWRAHRRAAGAALIALLAAAALLVPAAVGVPFIGVQPLRYAYTPLTVAVALLVVPASARLTRPLLIALALFALLSLPRTALRVPQWRDDGTLWSAELAIEPDNPYAAGSLARYALKIGRHDEGLALWRQAVETVPDGVRVFDRQQERYKLAQAAFVLGQVALAHEQIRAMIDASARLGRAVPANAYCLLADSADALGRPQEAAEAAERCSPSP